MGCIRGLYEVSHLPFLRGSYTLPGVVESLSGRILRNVFLVPNVVPAIIWEETLYVFNPRESFNGGNWHGK